MSGDIPKTLDLGTQVPIIKKSMPVSDSKEGISHLVPEGKTKATKEKNCCDWTPAQWVGVAFATAAFAIGLLGLLLHLGVFEMNASVALYMTIGGIGGAGIIGLLIGVIKVLDCGRSTAEDSVSITGDTVLVEGKKESGSCFTNWWKKEKYEAV